MESVISKFNYKTNERVTNIQFSSSDILKIIKDLNPNKAHGHDNISIKMIQLSIIPPLSMIFESAIKLGHFPDSWKRGNVVPVHKKESKNLAIITDQFHFYQYLGKYLKQSDITIYLHTSNQITFFRIISLVFEVAIHVFHN